MIRAALGATVLMAAAPLAAEVKAADAGGLMVATTLTIAAPPEKVYAALITPGRWWNAEHSWSGDAANMRLDPVVGGCFCETLPKDRGEVEHMRVVFMIPGKMLRLKGGLGPFQAMGVSGALSWELKPAAGGTEISQSYSVGGFLPGGGQRFAPQVDAVMNDQLGRLKAFVEKK